MTDEIIIFLVSFLASGLTLFSGFGLGTILMPAFALFFPLELAVAMTAIVHLFNNLFKLVLLGKYADKKVVVQFGLPALLFALFGAQILLWLEHLKPIYQYSLAGREFLVTPIKLIVAALIAVFVAIETNQLFKQKVFSKKYLFWGGMLSGFFGGLSGHQGALRSMFLVKSGLSTEQFIGTGVVIACLVDISRLSVYTTHFLNGSFNQHWKILVGATVFAFLGAFVGNRLIKKITLKEVQNIVSAVLLIIALLLGSGII